LAKRQNGKDSAGRKGKKMHDAGGAIDKTQNSRKRQKVLEMREQRRDKNDKFFNFKTWFHASFLIIFF